MTAAPLRVGQQLTAAEITTLQQADELENAKQSAIRFISYRPRSLVEVHNNLLGKGFDEATIAQATMRLQEVGLLDDTAFARFWVEQRETFKPRSHLALRHELQQKGISRDIIDMVLSDVDETAAAHRAVAAQATRWQHLPEAEFKNKVGGFLQRRGFSYSIIKEIADEIWQTVSSNQPN